MAAINLPYIQTFRDRHGRMRYYFRRKGCPRVALPGEAGSAEFMAAYGNALASGTNSPGSPKARLVQDRSVGALITEYYRSASFRGLRVTSQRPYRRVLEKFRGKHGHRSVAGLQPHHLNAIFHQMAETPHAAATLRKRLRKVLQLAVRLGWRQDNPVRETELDPVTTLGHTPWSDDDIKAFEARWPSGSRQRLALALLLYTGQRRSDVVSMGRQHVEGNHIRVVQLKTSARLKIRMHPRLLTEIAQHPTALTFLTTQYGAPFSAAGFTAWFVAQAVEAGLSGRTPHGLRKAASRRLAEAGCSAKQIGAITGHRTLAEIENYTRDADQARLGDAAMDMLIEAEEQRHSVKPV